MTLPAPGRECNHGSYHRMYTGLSQKIHACLSTLSTDVTSSRKSALSHPYSPSLCPPHLTHAMAEHVHFRPALGQPMSLSFLLETLFSLPGSSSLRTNWPPAQTPLGAPCPGAPTDISSLGTLCLPSLTSGKPPVHLSTEAGQTSPP